MRGTCTDEDTGFAVILIDPARFMPVEQFKSNVDAYVRSIKSSRKSEGVEEILLPGELEMCRFDATMKTGYEVTPALAAELLGYAVDLGLAERGATFEQLVASL